MTNEANSQFIAYKGQKSNLMIDEIKRVLGSKCERGFVVKAEQKDDVILSKIVDKSCAASEPSLYDDIITVSLYDFNEFLDISKKDFGFESLSSDMYMYLTFKYRTLSSKLFQDLREKLHFCSVMYDFKGQQKNFIAGITQLKDNGKSLYYGHPNDDKDGIVFSNDTGVLKGLCDSVECMSDFTYYENGKFYTIDGKEIVDVEPLTIEPIKPFIKKDGDAAKDLFSSLNSLLIQISDASIEKRLKTKIADYLASEEHQSQIEKHLLETIDLETQKQILQLIKKTIEQHSIETDISDKLAEVFSKVVADYQSKFSIPTINLVTLNDIVLGKTQEGFYHNKFEEILKFVQLNEPVALIGPAGSGKNVAVKQVADALGLHMYYTNNASNEFKLTGFVDAGGRYHETEFYKAFKNGGVFFLDEIDASDPTALIVINSALANGYMAFPHETIEGHPDFRMLVAANTYGKGADLQYVGRQALDAATLDRFDNIFFDYDRTLERNLYPSDEVLEFMWSFRDAIYACKIPYVVSTRGIGKVYKKEINGIEVPEILTSCVVKNLGQDDVNTIIGSMNNIGSQNKYYQGIKSLRLQR